MISLLIVDALENEQSLSLVEDWNSKISYDLRAIHERRGVSTCWFACVDAI